MTTTTNLLITHIESSQAQKEVTANDAFNNLDAAIAGRLALSTTGGTTTLTDAQARNAIMDVSGALTSNAVIVVPARSKLYAVRNATSGAFSLTVKTASGTGVMVRQGYQALLFCDGTNVGTATDAQMADHLAASDPHPQYATDTDLTNHINNATDAHDASAISNVAAGNIAAITVQDAINELDSEKAGLSLANTFTQVQTAPQFNIGDANARIKRVGTGAVIENDAAHITLSSISNVNIAANAKFDGTNWIRVDTAQPAILYEVNRNGVLSVRTAPAGANPISWSGPYRVFNETTPVYHRSGSFAVGDGATVNMDISLPVGVWLVTAKGLATQTALGVIATVVGVDPNTVPPVNQLSAEDYNAGSLSVTTYQAAGANTYLAGVQAGFRIVAVSSAGYPYTCYWYATRIM